MRRRGNSGLWSSRRDNSTVKLLFDQNLSPRLATRLHDLFPDSSHVFWVNLDQAEDAEVWSTPVRTDFWW